LFPPPKPRRFRFPGRKPLDQRKVLTGILFVLKTGVSWEDLPHELGCGCGVTCLNYLKAWRKAGVWQQVQLILRRELREARRIDWSRAEVDSSEPPILRGGEDTGPHLRTEAS
jgi:transposase